MEQSNAAELATQFQELGDFIDAGTDPLAALDRLLALAKQTIDGCEWAAVTQAGTHPRTLAVSDDVARAIDEVQIDTGEGPCLSAARDSTVIRVADLNSDGRWPRFARRALATTPVRSVLTFEIDAAEPRSALNLYASRPEAFDPANVATASLFASHARVAIMHYNAAAKAVNLEQALTSSRQIGAAIGILMATQKITEDAAFDLLRATSQNLNRKLRDIALEVTETGALP